MPRPNKTGWIPPDDRTPEQATIANDYAQLAGMFADRGTYLDTTPDRVILHELEIKFNGKLLARPHQQTGSCVGAGGGRAYSVAQVCDRAFRDTRERTALPFWLPTYGVGRELAGMRGTGSGSFGGAQFKAVTDVFGMCGRDIHPDVPKLKIVKGWASYTSREELKWSHPSAWPIRRSELEEEAAKHKVNTGVGVGSADEARQLLAQGYPLTVACSWGCNRMRVKGDYLIGRKDTTWHHQQACTGYADTPDHGLLFLIDNQWNDTHGACPTLSAMGVRGSYWVPESEFSRHFINNGEVFGHSNTGDFPLREFDWGQCGYPVDTGGLVRSGSYA